MRWSNRTALGLAAACSLVAPLPLSAADGAPSAAAVIAASRAAMGIDALPRVRTLRMRGGVDIVGVTGSGEQWSDLRDGRFAQVSDAGPLSGAQGWDGTHAWNRDAAGVVWDDGSTAQRYAIVQAVYLGTYALWSPQEGGAAVAALGRRTLNGASDDVLRVTPRGGLPFEAWFDAGSHLLVRTVVPIGTTTTTTTYADYRNVDGLRVAFTQRTQTEGGTSVFTAHDVEANPPGADAALRRPVEHVTDWTLPTGTTSIPFELVDNHVDLDVTIDGRGPYHFLFDTGGANVVDAGLAKELGLKAAGDLAGQGVGAATEAFQFATVDALGIGSATLRHQTFAVAPVRAGFGMSSGKPVDGLIGFEVLSRFVTTFDYAGHRVVLRAPGAAVPQGKTLRFVFNGEHMQIPCAIDGFSGDCTVDTGSRIGLSVDTPFLAAHPSIVTPDAAAVGANGFGVGGPALGRLGRTTLQFGGFTIPRVISDLSTQTKGAFADPFLAGNIGAVEWKRFTVTFDYPRRTITLVPNAAFDEPESYDRSGLFLIRRGAAIVVADVRPGTPAAAAGIARGDVVRSAAGRAVTQDDLAALRELFRGAPGTAIPLVVSPPGGTPRAVTLTLRDYV